MIREVATTVARDAIVVVGMSTNPFVGRARKALEKAGHAHTYLGYGGYASKWKQRLAIKMWSGWPTFPQIFVHGRLIGGALDLERAISSGDLARWLAEGRSA